MARVLNKRVVRGKKVVKAAKAAETGAVLAAERVDKLAKLEDKLAVEQGLFQERTAGMTTEIEKLSKLILQHAKKHKILSVPGTGHYAAEVKGKKTRSIEPEKLYKLLKKRKQMDMFFDSVKVQLTKAIKFLGEVTLESIIKTDKNDYHKIKVTRKK